MRVSLQIIIAALSVVGLYFCLKTLASLIFTNKQTAAAVMIGSRDDLSNLDLLLADAATAIFTARHQPAVLIEKELWNECGEKERSFALEVTEAFGAEIYFIKTLDRTIDP